MEREDFAATLISFQVNVSIQDENGQTPLHIVADLCNLRMIQMLIAANAPLNVVDVSKNSPLHLAALKMDKKCVETLIRAGSDTKLINDKGLTPMQGVRLTFSKFMKALVAEREAAEQNTKTDEYIVGKIYNQSNQPLMSQADLKESFCLCCKRRTAVAAMLPCGHLCVCEVCLKERVNTLKVCPYCKQPVTGAVNILFENS